MYRMICTGCAGLLALFVLTGCAGSAESSIAYADLPASGNPERGEALYTNLPNNATPCSSCHMEAAAAAPHLLGGDYPELAASRVEGMDAREYTFWAIVEPARHITEGYGNVMVNHYDERLSPQEIADIVAYLLASGE